MGRQAVSLSPFTLQDHISTGVQAELGNKKNYLFLVAGRQDDNNSLYDMPFTNALNNTGSFVKVFVSVKANWMLRMHTSVFLLPTQR